MTISQTTRVMRKYRDPDTGLILSVYFYFNDVDTSQLNIQIINSYKLVGKKKIATAIKKISSWEEFSRILVSGYKRSLGSLRTEWAAHNLLYSWNYKIIQTKDVNLDNNESFWRRVVYRILSWFYKK